MAGYRHPSTTINNIDIIDILVDPSFYDNPIGRQSHWTTIPLDDSPFGPGKMEEEGEGVGNDNPSANNASTIRLLIFCLPYLAV
jgi:hypothetical protein